MTTQPRYGWTATKSRLESRYAGQNKFYETYYLKNAETGESRAVHNYGPIGKNGSWKIVLDLYDAKITENKKYHSARSDYQYIEREVEVAVSDWLLEKAGIDWRTARRQHQERNAPPVEVSPMQVFKEELAKLTQTLSAAGGVTTEVLVGFNQLRLKLATIKREVREVEGSMEMLTAMMDSRDEVSR